MPSPKRLLQTLDRLAALEERFLASEFLAPVLPGGSVGVRIGGVVCQLRIAPGDFQGWAVCRPTSTTHAQVLRSAVLDERQRYLNLLPRLSLIVCRRAGRQWLATPAHQADARFHFEGLVPVHLVDTAEPFEVIEARFDGSRCWYDRSDERHDPANAGFLRDALSRKVEPEKLLRPGLTAEERAAYALAFAPILEAERDLTETRLRRALGHAEAQLQSYAEHKDTYRVEFMVDGERHVSVLDKRDLTVQVAGICLSGEDRNFDLQSLVGVLREASGEFTRVGVDNDGMDEATYWRVHPQR
jgi:hypothetical protein